MKNLRNRLLAAAFALAAFPALAGMVSTPKTDEAELEKALREALPGNAERVNRMLGQHAGNFLDTTNKISLISYLILFGIMAVIAVIGIIAILGYGFSKKKTDEDRLGPP